MIEILEKPASQDTNQDTNWELIEEYVSNWINLSLSSLDLTYVIILKMTSSIVKNLTTKDRLMSLIFKGAWWKEGWNRKAIAKEVYQLTFTFCLQLLRNRTFNKIRILKIM